MHFSLKACAYCVRFPPLCVHESNMSGLLLCHKPHAPGPLWYTTLSPVPFRSVPALGLVISSSSARDCLVRVEPALELNFCWLCIEFPLLCFIYAFHHHAESIFLLHSPHAMPFTPFLSLCSEVNGSFDKKMAEEGGRIQHFTFRKRNFKQSFSSVFEWLLERDTLMGHCVVQSLPVKRFS